MASLDKESDPYFSLLSDAVSRKIGNGNQILFWNDRWLGVPPFREPIPGLFQNSQNQSTLFFDMGMWTSEGWRWVRS